MPELGCAVVIEGGDEGVVHVVHVVKYNNIFPIAYVTCKRVLRVFLELQDDQCRHGGRR